MSKYTDLHFAKSCINPAGGFEVLKEADKTLSIRPTSAIPAKAGSRYTATPMLLGRLERLARARFEISELTHEDIATWRTQPTEGLVEIAQSVNASSQIENEHIRAEELSLVLAAVTEKKDQVITDELNERAMTIKSIYETYLWALTLDRKTFIDFDLVLELHSRMFLTTRGEIAGKLKLSEVSIRGAGYEVDTLPASNVAKYLRTLCEQTNVRLIRAEKNAEESMLLVTAEFILDFLAIHPFEDGNGRAARLLSTYLLERSGYHFASFYPLDTIILESREEYYDVLFHSQYDWWGDDEDLTPWVHYYVNAIFSQYIRALDCVSKRRIKNLEDRPERI